MILSSIYSVIIIIIHIIIINANSVYTVTINDENDIIKSFEVDSTDELILKIHNKKIDISNIIKINSQYKFKKISILGISKELSLLNFSNATDATFIIENEIIQEINFSNLTINGPLEIKNFNHTLTIENLILHGNINFERYSTVNASLHINNFQYFGGKQSKDHCINIYGNAVITNSIFYGSEACRKNILLYNGDNINSLELGYSSFDGVYTSNCISIVNSKNTNIYSSKFERGASYFEDEGGAITVNKSNITIKNCEFNDNFSIYNGGVLYIYESYNFEAQDIKVNNATAVEKGSFLYMYSSYEVKTKGYILNMEQYNTGLSNNNIYGGGLIASIEGYSSLYMENFYGTYFNGGNGEGAFTLNYGSSIELNNFQIHNITSSSMGGLLLTSQNEENSSFFKVNNGTFMDFYQYYYPQASSFIRSTNNIDIILENCFINNIFSTSGNFIYTEGPSKIYLNNVHLKGHYSKRLIDLIQCYSVSKTKKCQIILNDVVIDKFESWNDFKFSHWYIKFLL